MKRFIPFLLLLPLSSYGFEVGEYSSGMSKETVKQIVNKRFKTVTESENSIDGFNTSPDWMTFFFCKGKLQTVNIGWKADIHQLTIVSSEFEKKYGVSENHYSVSSLNTVGTSYNIDIR